MYTVDGVSTFKIFVFDGEFRGDAANRGAPRR